MADTNLTMSPSKGFKRTVIKAFTEAKVTPVILVCVYNQNSTIITHDLLYNTFSPYGKILRILIFEKMKIWKAFLEFDNLNSAFEAKRDLNDFLLFNDGTRMNVYYSNLDTIKFQNNNAGGKDYTLEDCEPCLNGQEIMLQQEPLHYVPNQEVELTQLYTGPSPNLGHTGFEAMEMTGPISNQPFSIPQSHSPQLNENEPDYDDKDDEILKMINDHQKESDIKEKSKEPQSISEEEKLDYDDPEKDIYSQFFTNVFQSQVPASSEKISKPKPLSSLSLKSKAFGVPNIAPPQTIWQQPDHEQLQNDKIPPGLVMQFDSVPLPKNMFPKQRDGSKLIGFSNSDTNIPIIPQNLNKPFSTFSNTREVPYNKPGLIPKNISHFHSMNNLPTSYGPPFQSSLQANQSDANGRPKQFLPMPRTNSRSSFDPNFGNQIDSPISADMVASPSANFNNLSYENMIDAIEKDIMQNWAYLQNSGNLGMLSSNNLIDSSLRALLQESNGENPALSNLSLSTLSQLYNELSVMLGKADNNKKSQVLYVKGLENSEIQIGMLYNIFSNFGNIVKIIFLKDKAAAFIEFENAEYAAVSKDYLNNIVFMGTPLRIYYSNYSIINPRSKKNGKESSEEIFIGTPKTFRFKKNKHISINPPSPVLHISNLLREVCEDEHIQNHFCPYGRIEGIRFMFQDNKNMCLLKMASIEESLIAMAYLHDTDLGGRKIQISFTRSKL